MSSELTIAADQQGFTPHQVAALAQIGVQDASQGDLAVFFHQVQRTGLDPFARQIYMIGRRQKDFQGNWVTKQTIQTGIDGFRLIARRAVDKTGETLSISEPYYATADGQWSNIWDSNVPPVAAKVMVKRGQGEFPAVAMFKEYAGTTSNGQLNRMWASKPAIMIGKCAEALALRKAFPLDLSGLYTAEEMDQASNEPTILQEAPAEPEWITPDQARELMDLQEQLGLDDAMFCKTVTWASRNRQAPTENAAELTTVEAGEMIRFLRGKLDEQAHQEPIQEPLPEVVADPYGSQA